MDLTSIDPSDLSVSTIRTGSTWFPSDNGIRILHIPSGIAAECCEERSQHKNKERAFAALAAKLLDWEPPCIVFITNTNSRDKEEYPLNWQPSPPFWMYPPAVETKQTIDSMIPKGWELCTADFSLRAAGKSKQGSVSLIRDVEGRKMWHGLSEPEQESTTLYLFGQGDTLEEAIAYAVSQLGKPNDTH